MQTIEPQIDRHNQKLHRTFLLQQIFQGIIAAYALLHLYYGPSHVKIVSLLELSGWCRMSQKALRISDDQVNRESLQSASHYTVPHKN